MEQGISTSVVDWTRSEGKQLLLSAVVIEGSRGGFAGARQHLEELNMYAGDKEATQRHIQLLLTLA